MSRITPAAIVRMIDHTFPWTAKAESRGALLYAGQATQLGMIVRHVQRLAPELLPTDPEEYGAFCAACDAMEAALEQWAGMGRTTDSTPLYPLAAYGGRAAPVILRDVLLKCPEQGVREDTANLEFVADAQLRRSLRQDLSAARSALERGDFKSATVLAGAVLEALLLDVLVQFSVEERNEALKRWHGRSRRPGERVPDRLPEVLDRWRLVDFIWVARCLEVISEEAAAAADVARDYRNLIHPGKLRMHVPADEGTGHSSFGAALRVAAELDRRRSAKPAGAAR